ncbi:hypothetical protein BH11ACT2_BH11ACT2_22970 [soil metagenome]
MSSRTPAATAVSKSLNTAFRYRPWANALTALVVGIVFGFFLRIAAIAALLAGGSGRVLIAVLVAIVAAIAFGALGRAFTGRRAGWVLAITVFVWAPLVIGAAFVIFAGEGRFNQSNLLAPLAAGIVAGIFALLAYKGYTRWIAIVIFLAGIVSLVVYFVNTAS